MEIESKSSSKIRLEEGSETFDFGRELGFISSDRAISRHHISFKLHEDRTRVYFEVNGKNPVWVRDRRNDEIRVYKRSEGGEIKNGDSFCVASKNPVWFNVKRIAGENEDDSESKSELSLDEAFAETSGIEYDEVETGDISHIDAVKEFGFVVVGHEFDHYPKKMLSDVSNWDWFLEEPKQESDEEEVNERKRKKSTRKRRKKSGEDDDDEVWTGESGEDAEIIKKMKNAPKPKYSTRSKEQKQNKKGASTSKSAMYTTKKYAKDDYGDDDVDEDEDEEDETLGGFIVDDGDIGDENVEDNEEEEFEDDEDEDE
ncbi:unnamed protein product [Lactuca virosa]|uniref:FHA domain-containing protein n=1 Tax=Lactuca virosa TaxID=75947 RepID=A0AAU9NXN3_9ASTR|nr:unnamed protein product [Lactuca virosa]